jgi:phosphoglycerol transferase MdoB-like AlkP superfamily enzyme
MNWIQKNFKKIIYVAFLVPILTVAGVSISHVTSWYGLSNPFSWAIYLSVGIEIAALSALAAISAKMGRKVYFPFGIVTLIQFIGNIFFAYQYIDVNSLAFKNWVDLVDPVVSYLGVESGDPVGHKRFLALFAGGMLPIISLSFLHMLVKFEEEEKKVEPIFDIDEISIEAGKKEAEIEKEKYTPTQEELQKLEEELRRVNEEKFGSLVTEHHAKEIQDPEIKRLNYTRRDA